MARVVGGVLIAGLARTVEAAARSKGRKCMVEKHEESRRNEEGDGCWEAGRKKQRGIDLEVDWGKGRGQSGPACD
jgi:hypothetical protein